MKVLKFDSENTIIRNRHGKKLEEYDYIYCKEEKLLFKNTGISDCSDCYFQGVCFATPICGVFSSFKEVDLHEAIFNKELMEQLKDEILD